MSIQEEVDRLRRVPLFAKVEPARLKLLAFASENLSFEPGEVLCEQGEAGDCSYLILDGEVAIEVQGADGPIEVARMGKDQLVGEIAILCDVPRTATVRALTPLCTLKIEKEFFFNLICEFPQIAFEVMRVLAGRLDQTTRDLTQARNQLAAS